MPNELRLLKQDLGITPSYDEAIQYAVEDMEDEEFISMVKSIIAKRKSNSNSSKRRDEYTSS